MVRKLNLSQAVTIASSMICRCFIICIEIEKFLHEQQKLLHSLSLDRDFSLKNSEGIVLYKLNRHFLSIVETFKDFPLRLLSASVKLKGKIEKERERTHIESFNLRK